MKDYRQSELRMYCISVILMYFLMGGRVDGLEVLAQGKSIIELILGLLNNAILSSTIYIIIYVLDSIYEGDFKRKLVYIGGPEPGQTIFTRINNGKCDPRFSKEDVERYYKEILNNLTAGGNKRDQKFYQNQQWYRIYHQYREVTMIKVSATDFRLCRDMFVATVNLLAIYIILSFIGITKCYGGYFVFLAAALVLTDVAARMKGRKWVYNVIAYDISERKKTT